MKNYIDSFLAWYFNLPSQGQDGETQRLWRLEASWNWQSIHIFALATCIICISVWLARTLSQKQPSVGRFFLIANRVCIILIVGLLLLQVRLRTVTYGRPKLTVLIDTSKSMALTDRYTAVDTQKLQSFGISNTRQSRIELLKDLFQNDAMNWTEQAANRFELEFHTFDTRLNDHSQIEESSQNEFVQNLRASGISTDFTHSLDDLASRERDRPSVSVILFSDGNPTTHSDAALDSLQRKFRRLQVPIHTIGIGSRSNTKDLKLGEAEFEPVGFAGEDHPISVNIEANEKVESAIQIQVNHLQLNQTVYQVTLDGIPAENSEEVPLILPNLASGRNDFEIEVLPLAGETNVLNNVQRFRVWGRDADLKLLLIDRRPRWEYRHLKASLERDPHIALQTYLSESDSAFAVEDRSAINRLPKSLEEVDAVILGDVDFSTLPDSFIDELDRFVKEQGGGLLLMSGKTSFQTLNRSQATAILHPAILEQTEPATRSQTSVSITAEGKAEGVFPVGIDDESVSQLPPVFPYAQRYSLQAAALTLLQGNVIDQGSQALPLILSMRYGRGIIIQHLFDDTWRWRSIQNGEFYRKVWSQMIRNLCRRILLDQLPNVELLTNHDEFRKQETIQIRLIDRGGEYQDRERILLQLLQDSQTIRTVNLTKSEQSSGGFSGIIQPLDPGEYQLSLASENLDSENIRVRFRVLDSDLESDYLPMNEELLRSLSESTQGVFALPWEMDSILQAIPNRKVTDFSETRLIPLWNRWELLLLLILFLSADWIFRRRAGLD